MNKSNLYSSSSEVSDFDRLCFIINIVDINKPANNLILNKSFKVGPYNGSLPIPVFWPVHSSTTGT